MLLYTLEHSYGLCLSVREEIGKSCYQTKAKFPNTNIGFSGTILRQDIDFGN